MLLALIIGVDLQLISVIPSTESVEVGSCNAIEVSRCTACADKTIREFELFMKSNKFNDQMILNNYKHVSKQLKNQTYKKSPNLSSG